MKYKDGDIVNWAWTDNKLKSMDLHRQSGTTYWCMSRIAIYSESVGIFRDTYWSSLNEGQWFKPDDEDRDIEFLANINDLRACDEQEFIYYDNADCINISHPNMARSGYYIKKEAQRSINKMKRVAESNIKYYQDKLRNAQINLKCSEKELDELTVDSYLPCIKDVYYI